MGTDGGRAWLGSYGRLLRAPGAPRLVAGHLVARLPTGIASVALLYTASHAHLCAPGLAIAAYAVAVALTTVVTSRLTDRRGLRLVLVGSAAATFAGSLDLVWRPGTAAFLVGAALLGTAFTPVGNGLRLSLLSPELTEEDRVAGNAYETVVMEVGALAGPTLAGGLIAVGAVDAGLVAIGVSAVVGVALMLSSALLQSFDATARPRERGPYLDLYRRGTWVVPVVAVLVTTALSGAEVGLFVAGSAAWGPTTAGLLVALTSAGSLVGGLAFGARAPRVRYTRLATGCAVLITIGLTALGLGLRSGSLGWAVATALAAQLGVAPLVVVLARLLPSLAPTERVAEAYGLLSLGAFSGAVLGGLASTALPGLAVFVPAVGSVALAAVLCGRLAAIAPRVAKLTPAPRLVDLREVRAQPAGDTPRARVARFARFGWVASDEVHDAVKQGADPDTADQGASDQQPAEPATAGPPTTDPVERPARSA